MSRKQTGVAGKTPGALRHGVFENSRSFTEGVYVGRCVPEISVGAEVVRPGGTNIKKNNVHSPGCVCGQGTNRRKRAKIKQVSFHCFPAMRGLLLYKIPPKTTRTWGVDAGTKSPRNIAREKNGGAVECRGGAKGKHPEITPLFQAVLNTCYF
jgi:hypothetical protein